VQNMHKIKIKREKETVVKGTYSHGQKVYKYKRYFYSKDIDEHNVDNGWKVALDSHKNLTHSRRLGTYSQQFERIGD